MSQSGDNAAPLVLSNIKAPKNGYAYIYLSNENDDAVYFDNFTVSDNRGRIIEENHYYAFGLKIAGISSAKFDAGIEGSLKNNYQYQGDYAELDEDIGWHDFALRNYDAQTGRWVQADPFGQFASPYCGMGNDPVNLIDPSGGIGIPCPGTSQLTIFFMKAGEAVMKGMDALGKISPWLNTSIDVARFGTGLYNNSVQFRMIDRQLEGNMTVQVGDGDSKNPQGKNSNSDNPNPLPPIFWEEYWYPSVEAADYDYSNTFYANANGQVITLPDYPNVKFLLFHREGNKVQKDKNGDLARSSDNNKGLITDSKLDDKHEVPYKSTIEGGSNAIMYPVNRTQNQLHGSDLAVFYERFNVKHGDPFLVPLYEPTMRPAPVRQFKPGYKPEIKIYDGSPFEWLLPSPTGAGALIEQLLKRFAF